MSQEGVDTVTIKQLNFVDVNFNNGTLEKVYPPLSSDSEYVDGVFFANTEFKGDYLLDLFNKVL